MRSHNSLAADTTAGSSHRNSHEPLKLFSSTNHNRPADSHTSSMNAGSGRQRTSDNMDSANARTSDGKSAAIARSPPTAYWLPDTIRSPMMTTRHSQEMGCGEAMTTDVAGSYRVGASAAAKESRSMHRPT